MQLIWILDILVNGTSVFIILYSCKVHCSCSMSDYSQIWKKYSVWFEFYFFLLMMNPSRFKNFIANIICILNVEITGLQEVSDMIRQILLCFLLSLFVIHVHVHACSLIKLQICFSYVVGSYSDDRNSCWREAGATKHCVSTAEEIWNQTK